MELKRALCLSTERKSDQMNRILKVIWLEKHYLLSISRVIVFMLALIVAACYIIQTFAVKAIEEYAKEVDAHSNLSTIEINSLRSDARILDAESISSIQHLKHVAEVSPWLQHDLDLSAEKDWPSQNKNPGSLWATTYFEPRLPKMVKGQRKEHLDEGEIILPAKVLGGNLTHLYGKKIQFGFSHVDGKHQGSYRTIELSVVGLYDNSVPDKDGEIASYVSLSTMKQLFNGALPHTYSFVYVKVDSAQNSANVQQQLATLGFSVTGAAGAKDAVGLVGTLANINDFVFPAVLICALIFGLFLSLIWLKQRRQDFALFRCLGYSRIQVSYLAFIQALIVNFLSSVIGLTIGSGAIFVLVKFIIPDESSVFILLQGALFDPFVALQLIGVSAFGTIIGITPFLIYAMRMSPDKLLRG